MPGVARGLRGRRSSRGRRGIPAPFGGRPAPGPTCRSSLAAGVVAVRGRAGGRGRRGRSVPPERRDGRRRRRLRSLARVMTRTPRRPVRSRARGLARQCRGGRARDGRRHRARLPAAEWRGDGASRSWITAVPIEPRGVLPSRSGSGLRRVVLHAEPVPRARHRGRRPRLPAEQVRVLAPDVGGGFGPKGSSTTRSSRSPRGAAPWRAGQVGRKAAASTSPRPARPGAVHAARIAFRETHDRGDEAPSGLTSARIRRGHGLTLNTVESPAGAVPVAPLRSVGTAT